MEGLVGSLGPLNPATGLKDIFVFYGPHQLATQSPENMKLAGERMAKFALAAARGKFTMEGAAKSADLRTLVLSAPTYLDTATRPDSVH